jgi:hypothetical protein
MLSRFGDIDFENIKDQERHNTISQAFMANVYYSYVYLRREALGPDINMQIRCPACHKLQKSIQGNLDTLEVSTAESLADAEWRYTLLDPLSIRGGVVKMLRMGPAKWFSIERLPAQRGLNFGVAKAALIQGSLLGTDSERTVLTEDDLDGLSKRDLENLTRLMDKYHVGPNMAVEVTCPCGEEIRSSLDWSYDSFFSTSSP